MNPHYRPYLDYMELFPDERFDFLERLPWQLSDAGMHVPFENVEELEPVFRKCAADHTRLTEEMYLDALYMRGGKYRFQEIVAASREELKREAAKVEGILY